MNPRFTIRPASSILQDSKRILDYTDSQIEHLASIGSGDQWGTAASASASNAAQEKYRLLVKRSEDDQQQQQQQQWGVDWIRVFMLDVEVDDPADLPGDVGRLLLDDRIRRVLPVAAMILEGRSSDYARDVLPEQDESDPFVYVRYLVTDRRVGALSKGAGRRLLEYADEVARALGVGRLCLDGWNGNGGLLVRYYERLGFVRLGNVIDGTDWPATVLERRVVER